MPLSVARLRIDAEQEAIRKLEKEVCGAVPLGKCAMPSGTGAHMIGCMHLTLCKQCESTVSAHVRGNSERAFKLARLMCPICRGLGVETSASADSVFELIDLNKSGTIESGELLLHLLVAGQSRRRYRSLQKWTQIRMASLALTSGGPASSIHAAGTS